MHCRTRIAKKTAERLMLDPTSAETLEWLVLKHLAVNVIAFRHDLSDPQIVLSFAAEVGSIRRLELLVVHTYADLVAVGPGVATDWKVNLIEDLYRRTRRYFDSGNLPGSPDDPEMESTRHGPTETRRTIGPGGKSRIAESVTAFLVGSLRAGAFGGRDRDGPAYQRRSCRNPLYLPVRRQIQDDALHRYPTRG